MHGSIERLVIEQADRAEQAGRAGSAGVAEPAWARAAEVLAAGGVVVAPTETVYGVFAADRRSLEPVVGDEGAQGAAWHAGSIDAAVAGLHAGGADEAEEALALSPVAERVVRRLLGGPVAVVVGGRAVRVPDHAGCARMLSLAAEAGADRIVAAMLPQSSGSGSGSRSGPSSGQGPGDEIPGLDSAGSGDAVVIDAGPTRFSTRSTVVRVEGEAYEVVREGAIASRHVDRLVRRRVLFVCTGNTCRSPMAAAIARHELGDDPYTQIASAGLSAASGQPMTPEAAASLRAMGVDPGEHRSRLLSESDLARADVVLAMTSSHLAGLGAAPADRAGYELIDPGGEDVPDPIGGPQAVYDSTASRLRDLVRLRLARLDASRPASAGGSP